MHLSGEQNTHFYFLDKIEDYYHFLLYTGI